MDRRNFFKIVGTASGGVLTGACGNQARELIPILVPATQIVPGEEQWHPSVCRECSAGCGTIVRVMEAEREIEIDGEKVREPIAAIKKIEGNPLDPVSGGRLCARGQAAVQRLYHPDRLQGPQKRSGAKGGASFESISWDEALDETSGMLLGAMETDPSTIVYLSGPGIGFGASVVADFLEAIGAPGASTVGLCDHTVERRASELVYGWTALPVYELQDATLVLSIGADFLGGWASPVFYSRRFGHFRQGRPGLRGRLVHAESRFSTTGWSADQWLPVAPGGEHALALAIGHLLLKEGRAGNPNGVPGAVREVFESVNFEQAAARTGLEPRKIHDVTRQLAAAAAPLVIAGASIVRENSLDAVVAASALNLLLDNVGKEGGVSPPADAGELEAARPRFQDIEDRLSNAKVVLLDGANPVFISPAVKEILSRDTAVVSFTSMIDDSTAFADLVLPAHDPLEAGDVVVPEVSPLVSRTGAPSFVKPLYDTRAMEDVLAELAKRAGKSVADRSTAQIFEVLYEAGDLASDWESRSQFTSYAERQGGWWEDVKAVHGEPALQSIAGLEPRQDPEPEADSFLFQAYPSLQFGDGSGASLPWLQQMPDPTSSAMWNLPVEIDPSTAASLGLNNGDYVRVTSATGSLEAPVYVHLAAIPGVVSMAIGQGHNHYGRYASGRGANPLTLVAGMKEQETGVPALGAARVRMEKIDRRGLAQFATVDREVVSKRP